MRCAVSECVLDLVLFVYVSQQFKSLGFNVPYEFNESDFSICHDLIIVFLDENPDKTPFDAMRYAFL